MVVSLTKHETLTNQRVSINLSKADGTLYKGRAHKLTTLLKTFNILMPSNRVLLNFFIKAIDLNI